MGWDSATNAAPLISNVSPIKRFINYNRELILDQKSQRIKCIRFLVQTNEQGKALEVLKLSLSSNKEDILFFGKKKKIKVSFHRDGKKYLRLEGKSHNYSNTLYENEHYSSDGINPIFSYIPSEINNYKTIPLIPENRTATIALQRSSTDFVINLFWVNANNQEQFLIPKNSFNTKFKCETHFIDEPSETISFNKPTAIEFGYQTLYFDIVNVKRSSEDRKHEILRIYKPGIKNHLTANSNHEFRLDRSVFEKQGFLVTGTQNDEYYTLVY